MIDPTVLFVTGARRSGDATASALESIGLRVISADGQLDAVKRLGDGEIDCVVLALPLDDPSAEWFVRRVRRTRDSLPILLLGDDGDASALAAGATDHVADDDVDRIADRIRELVADHRAERAVERHRALKERILSVTLAVTEATDRTEIERIVYERLSGVDRFSFVRVGAYDPDADAVLLRFPRETGLGPDLVADGARTAGAGIIDSAIATGTVQTSERDARPTGGSDVEGNDAIDDHETVAVPLEHEGTTHGVVVVGATRPEAIDGSTRAALEDLGSLVGRELHRLQDRDPMDGDDARRFAEGLAHELRNTIGIASTHLELGRDGNEDALDRAESAVDDLSRIVDGMLSLAAGVDETTERDLRADVRDAWEELDSPDADLVVEESAPIEADHDQVVRLFTNLLRNAVEHAATGESPSDAGDGSEDGDAPTIRVGMLESGFYVEDDGSGIPFDDRDRIFEWGYSATGGTGLGLGIVDAIADAHGWSVEAEDSSSGGARFEVTGVRRASDSPGRETR